MEKNADYRLLGIAVSDILKINDCKLVLINFDDMSSALIELTDKGECSVEETYQSTLKPDFYQTAAKNFENIGADELFELCKSSKRGLTRYLKTNGSSDEELKAGVNCKNLVDFYDEEYKQGIEQIIAAVKTVAPQNVNVVLVGKLSAFYPAEHTVKKAFSPMPFSPLDSIFTNDELSVEVKTLIEKGQLVLEKKEKEKKHIAKNIMLQFKRLDGTTLANQLFILAKEGTDFESLKAPDFSGDIVVHSQDKITIVVGGAEEYTLDFPKTLFSSDNVIAKVNIGLGIENDVPKLAIKSENRVTLVDIDTKIYSGE